MSLYQRYMAEVLHDLRREKHLHELLQSENWIDRLLAEYQLGIMPTETFGNPPIPHRLHLQPSRA